VIVVLLNANPLSVEVIVMVLYILYRGCCLREELCTLSLYYPNPQWNLEEIVQSPSSGIRLHSLFTLSVLQFIFNPHHLSLD